MQHQKARHFKCIHCNRKLGSASGMATHVLQVHKEVVLKIPGAKQGRCSIEFEIFGMEGIPQEYILQRQAALELQMNQEAQQNGEAPTKKLRSAEEIITANLQNSQSLNSASSSTTGPIFALPTIYNQPISAAPMLTKPPPPNQPPPPITQPPPPPPPPTQPPPPPPAPTTAPYPYFMPPPPVMGGHPPGMLPPFMPSPLGMPPPPGMIFPPQFGGLMIPPPPFANSSPVPPMIQPIITRSNSTSPPPPVVPMSTNVTSPTAGVASFDKGEPETKLIFEDGDVSMEEKRADLLMYALQTTSSEPVAPDVPPVEEQSVPIDLNNEC
ncbi:hypothetical protein AKO1_014160 [Acrasis kona]|uniref:C2H2-type domain-containing protein n=1 Tax=Acrasis kona TaxID=1008807 RepID=A0AAW2Z0R3_9EUKA